MTTAMPIVHKPGCTKPDVRDHCACGQNRSCRTCGWGSAAYPCACQRERNAARAKTDTGTRGEIDCRCRARGCSRHLGGEYVLPGSCGNCGWEGGVRLTRGHEYPTSNLPLCPECGCRKVYRALSGHAIDAT